MSEGMLRAICAEYVER